MTVLVVWGTAGVATAFVNVAEVVLAKDDLGAGNIGLGFLVSATGVGLLIGSFFAASALGALGMTRVYARGDRAHGRAASGSRPLSPTIAIVAVLAGIATIGNGAAIVCNQLLVQRGAPDAMRGRALAVLMSSYYAVLGLVDGRRRADSSTPRARASPGRIAGCIYLGAAVLAFVLTAGLARCPSPDRADEEPAGS